MDNDHLSSRTYPIGFFVLVIVCSIVMGLLFLPYQTLWTDEATQFVGLSQSWQKLLAWLVREVPSQGVPYDRSPPLSYIVGKSWCALFSCTPTSLRVLGILEVAVGTGFLFHTAFVNIGKWPALATGLLFALCPNTILVANEIRPYPLFLCLASIGFFHYTNLVHRVRKKSIVYLAIVCILATYTHLFGLVFSSAIFSSLMLLLWFSRKYGDLFLVALGFSVVLMCALGLIPFIYAAHSNNMSLDSKSVMHILRLGYRLVAHVSMTVQPAVIIATLVFSFVTVGYVLLAKSTFRKYTRALALPLVLGFLATATAYFAQSGFDAATVSYSVWMAPGAFLLMGAGAASGTRWWVKGCTGLLVLSYGLGAYSLLLWGSFFSHGPAEDIAELIRRAPTHTQAIVYEDDSDQIGMVFFPLNYLFGSELDQYYYNRPELEGLMGRLDYSSPEDLNSTLERYDYIYVITARSVSSKEIVQNIKSGVKTWPIGKVGQALQASFAWDLVENPTIITMTGAQVYLFQNKKNANLE